MVEYRPVPEEQLPVFDEYLQYAFRPERGPPDVDPDADRPRLGAPRGVYEGGAPSEAEPLCVCQHYWLEAAVRGDDHPTPGLAAVASPPEHRHGGNVRALLRASLREYRDRGAHFSLLWPFRYRYYRQFGWDTASQVAVYECEPDALAFASDDPPAADFRSVAREEAAQLDPVYEAAAEGDDLRIRRSEAWWRHRVAASYGVERFVYAAAVDDEDRGYIVYRIDEDEEGMTMHVDELTAVDHETRLALLAFCHRHESQVDRIRVPMRADTGLLDWAPDPESIECGLHQGPMVRIVDVADALSALSAPAGQERLTLAVTDELAPWNDAVFDLAVDGDGVTCERTDQAADLSVGIAGLSQLVVGYRSARDLETVGRLSGDRSAVTALDRAFPPRTPYLKDRF